MRRNPLTYIFMIVVLAIIGYAIYYISNEQKNNVKDDQYYSSKMVGLTDIRLGIISLDTLNPILSKNKNAQDVAKLIMEPLLDVSNKYKIECCLAQEWAKVSETSYIIKLKKDVKWHDEMLLVAEDVKFTIEKIKEVDSIYNENVKNIISVEIIDSNTVKLNLDKNVPFFEYNLIFPILPSHYYVGEDFVNTSRNQKPLGTGPYKISIIEQGKIILSENANWARTAGGDDYDAPKIKTVIVNLYNSAGEMYNALKVGNIDIINTSNINWRNYIGTFGFQCSEVTGREHDILIFNCANELLGRNEIRQAIASSIDRTNIISNVFDNKYYSSEFPLDYDNWLYEKKMAGIPHDIEYAKQKLVDNGWTYKYEYWQKTESYYTLRIELDLIVKESETTRCQVADIIKADLEKSGIKINVRKVSDYIYNLYIQDRDYDIILTGKNVSLSPDLSSYFEEGNLSNYDNSEIKLILNEINGVTDEKILKEKYKSISEIYKQEVPFVSLYSNKNTIIYSKMLIGEITPNWYNIFYNIENWQRFKK